MADIEHYALNDALLLLATAVVVVALFRRLGLPPIVGYVCVGIVAGPNVLGWLEVSGVTQLLGEIGVAFLLFTIGLEFSINRFLAMRRILLQLGGAQVLAGTLSGGFIAWMIGMPWQSALVVGGALSMSSTAIVIKQLVDQSELQTQHGRLAVGVLLFQDLAAVPFLVVIPLLAQDEAQFTAWPLLVALLKGAFVFVTILAAGRWVLRPLFREVAAARSVELFTLTTLLVSLAAAWLTSKLGLSLALGAFLAGMMLSETEFRHQVDTDIRPFRDVFLGLFFILVGMQLDATVLPDIWRWVVLLVSGLILGKGLVIVLLTRISGFDGVTAVRTGIVLGHGGEFGIALLALGLLTGLISNAENQPILAAVVITMALAPLLIRFNGRLAARIFSDPAREAEREQQQAIEDAARALTGHVIICGFGRIGKTVATVLRETRTQFVALDLDVSEVKEAWERGDEVFYGNAAHPEILEAAGLRRARAVVTTFDHLPDTLKLLHLIRSSCREVPVLVRTRDDSHLTQLYAAGANEVIPETLEAGLMVATQLLLILGVPVEDIFRRIDTIRHRRYPLLRELRGAEAAGSDDPIE